MKKYKFMIKKSKETEVEIYAENHLEALTELLKNAVKNDRKFFIEETEDNKKLSFKVEKIIDENGKENLQDYENFMKENSFFIGKENGKFIEENEDEDVEEIEDDLPKEYTEVVCDNCGHCILMDEIIHQLYS